MRFFIFVFLFLFTTVSRAQFSLVNFPDSAKQVSLFTWPTTTPRAIAPFYGILTVGQPYDSLDWEPYYKNQPAFEISDSLRSRFSMNKGLSIVIDTIQTVRVRACLPADSTDMQYFIETSSGIAFAVHDPFAIEVAGMPVYILNLAGNEIRVWHPRYSLVLIQQALLGNGQWVDVEQSPASLLNRLSVHTLKQGQFIVSVVPKYKGGFFTKLRLKLISRTDIFYSEEFWGEISKTQVLGLRG